MRKHLCGMCRKRARAKGLCAEHYEGIARSKSLRLPRLAAAQQREIISLIRSLPGRTGKRASKNT